MTNGNVDITEGATLTLNSLNNNTYGGLITGGGGLVMNSGSLYLTNDNTYTGGTTLKNSSMLYLGNAVTDRYYTGYHPENMWWNGMINDTNYHQGSIKGNVTLQDNSTLTFNNQGATTWANVISGSGNVAVGSLTALTMTNANTYTGSTLLTSLEDRVSRSSLTLAQASDSPSSTLGSIQNSYMLRMGDSTTLNFNYGARDATFSTIIHQFNWWSQDSIRTINQNGTGTLTLDAHWDGATQYVRDDNPWWGQFNTDGYNRAAPVNGHYIENNVYANVNINQGNLNVSGTLGMFSTVNYNIAQDATLKIDTSVITPYNDWWSLDSNSDATRAGYIPTRGYTSSANNIQGSGTFIVDGGRAASVNYMESFTGQTNINAGNLTIQSGMTNGNVDITEGATLTLNSLNNNT
jgi:hypothetical protein